MKSKLLISAAALVTSLAIPSCVDPGLGYGYSNVSISSLPHGYRTVHVGGSPYYYANNSWYRRSNGRYIISSRPHGYTGSIGRSYGITRLPSGYRSFSHGGSTYYSHGNDYYRKSNGRYIKTLRPSGYSSHHRTNSTNSYNSRYTPSSIPRSHSGYSRPTYTPSRVNHSSHSNYKSHGSQPSRGSYNSNSSHRKQSSNSSRYNQTITTKPTRSHQSQRSHSGSSRSERGSRR